MSDLDSALKRLNVAIEAAEAAVGRAIDQADLAKAREEELQTFADDRQRLAGLLDTSAAQAEAAEARRRETAREIAARVDAAIASVESVLAEVR